MPKIDLKDVKDSRGNTNWPAVMKQTDADIEKNTSKSIDTKPLTVIELAQLRRAERENDHQ